jgi:hypothetical protein
MALAFIEYDEDLNGNDARFRIDIGTNRYYAWAVGANAAPSGGVSILQDRTHTSDIHGPLDERLRGRTVISVPHHLFDREHQRIQLLSFRDADGTGPAASKVLRVAPVVLRDSGGDLSPLSFSRSADMTRIPIRQSVQSKSPSVAFAVREGRPVSRAFFLQALLPLLPQILPAVMPIVSNLLGGGSSGTAPPPVLQQLGSPRTAELLIQLIQQLTGRAPATPQTAASRSAQASVYSGEMALPLLAALPALMPLLQQVLNPQTIQAIGGIADPSKLISTVTQGLQQLGALGIQADRELMEHLRAIHPGTNDPELMGLLQSMSVGLAETAEKQIRFRRVESVRLLFADVEPQLIGGRTRIAYRRDAGAAFPMAVETPRPIKDATLQIMLKHGADGRVLFEAKQRVARAESGRLEVAPAIPAHVLRELEAGEDYLVCVSLAWKTRGGKKIGTSMTQMITLVDELTFDRAVGEGPVIPLNDVQRYRDFWHKAWEGAFDADRKRLVFDCRYYYAFDPKRERNGRMETQSRFEKSGLNKEDAKLRTGVLVAVDALNALTPAISTYSMLGAAELAALRTDDFARQFHQAARFRVKLRGRPGQSAALWVYPEMRMHRLTLRKAAKANEAGHVLEFSEQTAWLPMPVLAHFIGTETQR